MFTTIMHTLHKVNGKNALQADHDCPYNNSRTTGPIKVKFGMDVVQMGIISKLYF